MNALSPEALRQSLSAADAPLLLDVRRAAGGTSEPLAPTD